jgi:U4/U6.U5 tri-snRNP-associated protein 1
LKVAHGFEEMAEGDEQILTLMDTRVLDDKGRYGGLNPSYLFPDAITEDELQNVLLAEHERTQRRIELKTKNKDYTGYDDEEFTNGQEGTKRNVLSKYDDDITGAQEQVRVKSQGRFGDSFPRRVSDLELL